MGNSNPIPWGEHLQKYPGNTVSERFTAMCSGRTYGDVAAEIGRSVSAVKSFAAEHGRDRELPGRKAIEYVVRSRIRPSYAVMMHDLINQLSSEVGLPKEEFLRWISTKRGVKFFKKRCGELKFPLFICRYKERRTRCRKS